MIRRDDIEEVVRIDRCVDLDKANGSPRPLVSVGTPYTQDEDGVDVCVIKRPLTEAVDSVDRKGG
ncbi:MAG: hypothetical protein R3324_19005 [Halobacteriales archaeon]|nr:hypothetical protein [Halobacteriales archaeon]